MVVGDTIVLMSDQTQEESVSLHSHDGSPQPSAPVAESSPTTAQPEVGTMTKNVEQADRQISPAPQTVPESAMNTATPFASEFYDTQQRGVSEKLQPVSWTASEYIAHSKGLSWYLALGAIVIVLTVLIFFITGGDIFSSVCILILAVIFGVYAGRQPQEQEYVIDENGVSIGKHTYGFDTLKSFSVIDEGAFSSIVFMPMKRFMPLISIYYDPADEDRIIGYLSSIMPMEYRKRDTIDRLMHKIKF